MGQDCIMERNGKKFRNLWKVMERNEELEFLQHCHDNNLEGVADCLSRGVDVNTVSEDGRWSGLTIAATKNYPELLEILLSHPQIKINNTKKHNRSKWTALGAACSAGNYTIVSRLVQVPGLDINYQEDGFHTPPLKDGWTAAHWASVRGHTECVRILAETGKVNWNMRERIRGRTPLYLALAMGHSDIVDIIVQQPNIDYNVKDEDGDTLGHAAVRWGDVKCVETLAAQESCDCWNVPDSNGDTPIMLALNEGKTEIVKILLRCPRVNLDVVDRNMKHLEDTARERNMTEILDLLWTSNTVQQRMILRDSLLTRQAGSVPSLQSLSRDAVLLILSTNNSQERLVTPLVDRLQGEITTKAREILLTSYPERREEMTRMLENSRYLEL